MADSLSQKRVFITGGASGIGLATALELARAGCRLAIADIHAANLEKAQRQIEELGAEVAGFLLDVSDREMVERVAAQASERFGGIDVLVNNAGVGLNRELAEMTPGDWQRLLDVNLWGVLNCTYAFLPKMIASHAGQIVNIATGQVFFRLPTWGAYTAAKAAVEVFSEVLSAEVGPTGISVTTVFPFLVSSGFYDDVEGESWGSKLAMKVIPLVSQTPQQAAAMIVEAIRKRKRFEWGGFLNRIARTVRVLPLFPQLFGFVTHKFLGKGSETVRSRWIESSSPQHARS